MTTADCYPIISQGYSILEQRKTSRPNKSSREITAIESEPNPSTIVDELVNKYEGINTIPDVEGTNYREQDIINYNPMGGEMSTINYMDAKLSPSKSKVGRPRKTTTSKKTISKAYKPKYTYK